MPWLCREASTTLFPKQKLFTAPLARRGVGDDGCPSMCSTAWPTGSDCHACARAANEPWGTKARSGSRGARLLSGASGAPVETSRFTRAPCNQAICYWRPARSASHARRCEEVVLSTTVGAREGLEADEPAYTPGRPRTSRRVAGSAAGSPTYTGCPVYGESPLLGIGAAAATAVRLSTSCSIRNWTSSE